MRKYHALDKDGMARVGEKLEDGDVFLNKHVPDMSSVRGLDNGMISSAAQVDLTQLEFKPEM